MSSRSADVARPWECLLLLGIILFVAVVRINLLEIPYERDDGAYIYFGQMIDQGQTPYRDFYEDKPPGNMYAYAASVRVFGPNLKNQHAAFLLLNVATLLLLYYTVRRLLGAVPAICASFAFAVVSLSRAVDGFTCQSEHIVIFFAAAGMALLLAGEEPPPAWKLMLAGLSLGMSCWVKQSGIFFLLWGCVAALTAAGAEGGTKRRLRDLLWFAGGAAAVSFFFLALMARLGVFREFWFWAVEMPRRFVSTPVAFSEIKARLYPAVAGIFYLDPSICALALCGLAAVPFIPLAREKKALVGLLALCSLMTVVPGFTFFNHYWLQLLPVAAVGVGVAVDALRRGAARTRRASTRLGAALLCALFSAGAFLNCAHKIDYYFGDDYAPTLRMSYGYNPFVSAKIVGDYLRGHTTPGEKLGIFGSEPEIFLYSRCSNATRHAFVSHLLDEKNPYSAAWQDEYLSDIEKAAPRYFVLTDNPLSLNWEGKTGAGLVKSLEQYLARSYTLVGVTDESVSDGIHPRVLWDDEARNYVPKGALWMAVYKRKS